MDQSTTETDGLRGGVDFPVPPPPQFTGTPIYEQLLDKDFRWALSEGSRHFDKTNAVFRAMYRIAARLDSLGIPYAVVGGMALFAHGLRRFTEDVDLVVTPENLTLIHEKLEGLGYVPPFSGSKHLRDAELGVKVEFLTTGGYPGDGKEKPVSFPDPIDVQVVVDGVRFINLPTLVNLKLASGMTNILRGRDISDVVDLITTAGLTEEFANQLNPYVREKYLELWRMANDPGLRAPNS
jgi:hypothetical protein